MMFPFRDADMSWMLEATIKMELGAVDLVDFNYPPATVEPQGGRDEYCIGNQPLLWLVDSPRVCWSFVFAKWE